MFYGTELSSVTTRQNGKKYLSFDTSGAVVQKTYGSSAAPVVIVNAPPAGTTINPATTYIFALNQDSYTNAFGGIIRGKIGIRVYINATLFYEKYLVTNPSLNSDGAIYSDDTTPWFWKTSGNIIKVTSNSDVTAGTPPAGSFVQNYYSI